tara:strand:+ start:4103 stop:4900 length:798 start_codon:yes stop_codon:yes gene_type:complete
VSDLELHYKELNIGKTITCLLHSFRTETPCVLISPIPPFNLDVQYDDYDFAWLGIDKATPLQVWDRLCFLLSMSGILLFPNNIAGYRKENENLVLLTNFNKKITISYDKLNEFDHRETGWYHVYDFYDWRVGGNHDVDEIIDPQDEFIKNIKFFSSERENVGSHVKDLVGISYLSESQLNDLEMSPTYSRLKMLQMIKKEGINGSVVGYNSKGLPKFRKPVIEFNKRVTVPHYVPEISFKNVYEMKQKKGYTWKLLEKMTQHTFT